MPALRFDALPLGMRGQSRLCQAIARVTSTGTWASAAARSARGRARRRALEAAPEQSPMRGVAERSMSIARLITAATLRSATVKSSPSRYERPQSAPSSTLNGPSTT